MRERDNRCTGEATTVVAPQKKKKGNGVAGVTTDL